MNETNHYDLIVVGAGPGGYETALEAAEIYGMKTALIEKAELGGTCLNRGCIPVKALLRVAETACTLQKEGETLGLQVPESWKPDLKKMQEWKETVLTQLRDGIRKQLKKSKVTVICGTGKIAGPGCVTVQKPDGEAESLTAENILIASGSEPSIPPIPGKESPRVLTSDGLLDLREIPESLVVIGGGVIGMEMAYLYSALGTRVTVLEALPRILPNMDEEISRSLKLMAQKERGIEIHTGAMVSSIEERESGLVCRYTEKEAEKQAEGAYVLMAVGRRPFTKGLPAENAPEEIRGILPERGPVQVNEHFETAVPGIYAIGDVIGGLQLAHAATAEGKAALAFMNGRPSPKRLDLIPSCVYTTPEIASIGMTASEAKEAGTETASLKLPMGTNGKSVLSGQERGYIRIVAEKESGRILGAHLMCGRATDMISLFTLAIQQGLSLRDMAGVIYPHPSFAEAIGECCYMGTSPL